MVKHFANCFVALHTMNSLDELAASAPKFVADFKQAIGNKVGINI